MFLGYDVLRKVKERNGVVSFMEAVAFRSWKWLTLYIEYVLCLFQVRLKRSAKV